MKYILSLTLGALVLSGPAVSRAAQENPSLNGDNMVRISVREPEGTTPAPGIALTLAALASPVALSSTLSEAEAALIAYLRISPGKTIPVPGRTVLSNAEARQKLARILQQSSPEMNVIFDVGGKVSPPTVVKQVTPQYSDAARTDRVQGAVELMIVVRENGSVGPIEVTRSLGYGLDEKAIEAVQQWQFKPAMNAGLPVPVYVHLATNFALAPSGPNSQRTAVTNAQGDAVFRGLAPGRYAVYGKSESLAGVLSVTASSATEQPAQENILVLRPTANVSGIVRDSNGALMPNARVVLGILTTREGNQTFLPGPDAATNAEGEYRFTSVPAGTYGVVAQVVGIGGAAVVFYPGVLEVQRAVSIPIREGEELKIDVYVPPPSHDSYDSDLPIK